MKKMFVFFAIASLATSPAMAQIRVGSGADSDLITVGWDLMPCTLPDNSCGTKVLKDTMLAPNARMTMSEVSHVTPIPIKKFKVSNGDLIITLAADQCKGRFVCAGITLEGADQSMTICNANLVASAVPSGSSKQPTSTIRVHNHDAFDFLHKVIFTVDAKGAYADGKKISTITLLQAQGRVTRILARQDSLASLYVRYDSTQNRSNMLVDSVNACIGKKVPVPATLMAAYKNTARSSYALNIQYDEMALRDYDEKIKQGLIRENKQWVVGIQQDIKDSRAKLAQLK